jgi:hypothetical protein
MEYCYQLQKIENYVVGIAYNGTIFILNFMKVWLVTSNAEIGHTDESTHTHTQNGGDFISLLLSYFSPPEADNRLMR